MICIRLQLIAVLCLALALQACSQFGGTGGSRRGGGDRRSGQEAAEQRPLELTRLSVNDQIRLRLTDLRLALNLAPGQAAAWQAYENHVIAMLADSAHDAGSSTGGNALSQVDQRVAAGQRHVSSINELANAARTLYSTLTDEQKRVADRLLAGTIPVESPGVAPPARGGR